MQLEASYLTLTFLQRQFAVKGPQKAGFATTRFADQVTEFPGLYFKIYLSER
jgi:hypothetical protein